jgi:hypothetical protein
VLLAEILTTEPAKGEAPLRYLLAWLMLVNSLVDLDSPS